MLVDLALLMIVGGSLGLPSFVLPIKDMESCVKNANFFNVRVANEKHQAICFDLRTQAIVVIEKRPEAGENID